jgi:hypothetical protein
MARSFNGTSDQIDCGTGVPRPVANAGVTQMAWIYPTSFPHGYNCIQQINDGGTGAVQMYVKSTGQMAWYINFDNVDPGSATLSTNAWYNVLHRHAAGGGNLLETFINGVSDGTTTSGGATQAVTGGHYVIGFDNTTAGRNFAGRIARCALWNVTLTNIEVAALATGALPISIRPGNLMLWEELHGLVSPEPDYSGNKNNGILTGTAFAFGPPVMPFTPRWPITTPFTVPPPFVLMPQIVT